MSKDFSLRNLLDNAQGLLREAEYMEKRDFSKGRLNAVRILLSRIVENYIEEGYALEKDEGA
jgi:hypothetical protein